MRSTIPEYSSLVSILAYLCENAMQSTKSLKKSALVRVSLAAVCSDNTHEVAIEATKKTLKNIKPLAYTWENM